MESTLRARAVEELGVAWRELSAAQRRLRGREAMQSEELSVPQYNLLRPLLDHQELASGELSASAGLTPATATHMLEQLAKSGVVERERSEIDRRVVTTRLTPEGRERMERKDRTLTDEWEKMICDLDERTIARSAEVLRRMARYVDGL